MDEHTNYRRFYALLKQLPGADKETLVEQYTNGRTVHLREMAPAEYDAMCRTMERATGYAERRAALRQALRRARSAALHRMQLLGIDTTDWTRINAFCRDSRIAGKAFRELDCEELEKLTVKLRMMQRKGGLKPKKSAAQVKTVAVLLAKGGEA